MQVVQEDSRKNPHFMGETIKNLGQLLTQVLLEVHMGEKGKALAILVVKEQTLIVDMTTELVMEEQMDKMVIQ